MTLAKRDLELLMRLVLNIWSESFLQIQIEGESNFETENFLLTISHRKGHVNKCVSNY